MNQQNLVIFLEHPDYVIADVFIFWDRPLSDEEMKQVQKYMFHLYGLDEEVTEKAIEDAKPIRKKRK